MNKKKNSWTNSNFLRCSRSRRSMKCLTGTSLFPTVWICLVFFYSYIKSQHDLSSSSVVWYLCFISCLRFNTFCFVASVWQPVYKYIDWCCCCSYLFDFTFLGFYLLWSLVYKHFITASQLPAWLALTAIFLSQFQPSQSVFRRFYDIINIILFDSDSMVKINCKIEIKMLAGLNC